jgi:hypothetical protein
MENNGTLHLLNYSDPYTDPNTGISNLNSTDLIGLTLIPNYIWYEK